MFKYKVHYSSPFGGYKTKRGNTYHTDVEEILALLSSEVAENWNDIEVQNQDGTHYVGYTREGSDHDDYSQNW